jgi:ankyrin repeat protein
VDCQIKALQNCLDYPRLRAALRDPPRTLDETYSRVLESIPRTLDETYSRVLESIPRDHIQYAMTVLILLTWSQRPLRLDEIVDAVAVDLEASPTFDPRNRLPYPQGNFTSLLQSLISVVENTDGKDQERNWQVHLAHLSVRDFLLSGRVHDILGLRMDQSFANAQIAKICLAYLSDVTAHNLPLEDMKSQFPFAQYSAEYWSDHAREAEVTGHVLSDVVAALQAASSKGHDMMVQILLDGGADANAQGGEYGNALQAASANGHINILKMLLSNGADINARNGRYGTALNAALLSGSYETVRTLLKMGADVNAQDKDSRTVLYGASQKGLELFVGTLLEFGADTDARGGEYGTALQVAALEGHREITRILVDHGADVNAQSHNHGTALHIASQGGHESIVRILLDSGADIMTAGQPGSTLLHTVARKGLTQILALLLSRVADIGIMDSAGCSLIDIAVQKGHLGVVKLLLDQGADVSTTGIEGWTPLNRAAHEGHYEVVKLLIEREADIEITNNLGRTPIYSAAEKGHIDIIGVLLDNGAKVNDYASETNNPIWGASHRGHDKIMQVQLARASRSQGSHSEVAYSEFHDSGYSSRQTQPIVDECEDEDAQPFDDEIESVGSVETDIQSSTESLAFSNVREAAAREIAKAFNEDEAISTLYDEGLKRMDDSRFIKNHRRLLKLFYLEAARDAEFSSHHVVLRFLRSRIARVRVSARIIEVKDPHNDGSELDVDRGQSLRLINGILTQADKRRDTSRWTEALQSDLDEHAGVADISLSELAADDMDDDGDFDDFGADNEEEAGLSMDDLPALANMTAFLMDGRAFRIYRNNLQRLAYGKSIAPTAFRHALVADDLVLAIELLENEPEAVTQSRLGFVWIKEPLAMGFVPSEVVRLIIRQQEDPSWKEEGNQAIGVGRWNKARESIRGEEPGASHKRLITEYFIATDHQAISSPEQHDDLLLPLESEPDLLENLAWKQRSGSLKTRTQAICLDVWKQGTSRIRESIVWSGLILGPLQSGYTRITWKDVSSVPYTLL